MLVLAISLPGRDLLEAEFPFGVRKTPKENSLWSEKLRFSIYPLQELGVQIPKPLGVLIFESSSKPGIIRVDPHNHVKK